MRRLFSIVFALVVFAAAPPAGADADLFGLVDADRAAIVRVIDTQMQAFQRDDGNGAFAVASPGIRRMFGDADTFMTMVRDGYRPVYRPQRVRFLDIVDHHGRPAQRVYVVGPNGVAVVALYLMERQADGRWLIDGCILTRPAQARTTDPAPVITAAGTHRLRLAQGCRSASLAEAEALADRAADLLGRIGPERALPAFMDPAGGFIDRDLYVFVLDLDGNLWANGAFPQAIGSNALSARDSHGRPYVADMIRVAERDGRGWVAYEWVNPCTGTMSPKVSFIRRVGSFVIGVGAYGTLGAGLGRDGGRRCAERSIGGPADFEMSRVSG